MYKNHVVTVQRIKIKIETQNCELPREIANKVNRFGGNSRKFISNSRNYEAYTIGYRRTCAVASWSNVADDVVFPVQGRIFKKSAVFISSL